MCSLTSERLTDPVRLAAASSSADGAVFERSAVLSRIKMGLGRFADVTPEQLVTCRRTAALLLSHPRGLAALTWTDGGKPRRNPSLFEWDWGRLASTAADASFLNLCGERPGSVLRLVPTLELARASTPCLTRQAQGLVSVLVGRGKDVARSAPRAARGLRARRPPPDSACALERAVGASHGITRWACVATSDAVDLVRHPGARRAVHRDLVGAVQVGCGPICCKKGFISQEMILASRFLLP
ncbi:hypothetical protein EMIHUDRAFT_442653 [Emiliania huxleyi CCMP1516]|uniref:Uncharacterized protein n=2 Tax=Emiliania huxleyi TaxID=2903 RepID=A0A0D3K275_EMIH1|nr:hypothetical protein EMIHUDRAFT_442653 [Emiliania huxleyi CCMP1516]EOD29860.1 hypothetical protein EMIHUDRAFT_442653 [Emiliania huxleyi CCMP1516]|eukprot:XP_005782289.1 hypothetical protein EMIHUDRAFT_442653 [Emiliania huxleyi CCMP1516]